MSKSIGRYGDPPVAVQEGLFLGWHEFMHWLYLPVKMGGGPHNDVRLPANLGFAEEAVAEAMDDAWKLGRDITNDYVYVTARRGYATPDNPLNRPGWHCDGFGTDDLNYVWSDRWPTRFWVSGDEPAVSPDHLVSLGEFETLAFNEPEKIRDVNPFSLHRLSPFVIHDVPLIPDGQGGMRSFLKVSFSKHRYNLVGNSHNHLFAYDWEMFPRDVARNDPAHAGADFYEDS